MPYTPKMPRKRSRAKKKKDELTPLDWIKIVLFVVGAAALVSVFIFLRADIGNVADDYGEQASELNAGKEYSKNQFNKQFEYANEQKIKDTQENGSNSSSSSVTVNVKGDGQFIDDTTLNPLQIPMYDGYTMDSDSFDIDYSRFWDNSYPNPELHGLADFTNSAAKNSISFEFQSNDPRVRNNNGNFPAGSKNLRNNPTLKNYNGIWTVDGRIAVALPPGALIEPSVFEPLIESHWTNTAKYTGSDGGTRALQYVAGVFSGELLCGLYVDVVLEDGVVLPMIVTDTKALHTGIYSNGDDCRDNLLEGYAHWRGTQGGGLSYKGILEICITSDYKSNGYGSVKDHLNLSGNKIAGFRIYKGIYNFKYSQNAPTEFNNVFTGGN